MSPSVEAAALMRQIAEPAPVGAHIETLIRDVGRKVGVKFSRAKALWYREARIVRAEEMDAIRAAAARKQGEAEREVARKYGEIVERIARLESRLGAPGEN